MLEKPADMNPMFVTAPKGKVVIDIPDWATKMGMWWSDDGKSVNYAFYGAHDKTWRAQQEEAG